MRDGYIETCIINQNTVNIITLNGYQMFAKILVEENDHIVILSGGKRNWFSSTQFPQSNPQTLKLKLDKCAVL